MHPVTLPSNRPRGRFYEGGQRIADLRGEPPAEPNTPEDWVASVTSVRGHPPIGMTRLPDGRILADAIADAPIDWLGPDHVARYGIDTKLLVKLLDPGQRLPIHAHPHDDFAAEHLGTAHGKAEAWYILAPGTVWLGLTRDVPRDELLALVDAQDTEKMLALMHRIEVQPNDTVYVPPGLLHAIGKGVVLAEVQEPEDLSILLEWKGFDLDGVVDGHLDLGFDVALQAVETRGRTAAEVQSLLHRVSAGSSLVGAADEYFRLDRVTGDLDLPAGFAVVIGLEGGLRATTGNDSWEVTRGSTTLVPYGTGPTRFRGGGDALVARPPV
jgi:mannose-6-phosphate isomerase